jgi:hypothetical protein
MLAVLLALKKKRKEKPAMQRAECWLRWFSSLSGDLLRWPRPKQYAPGQEHNKPDCQADTMARKITPLENARMGSQKPRLWRLLGAHARAGCLWSG